MVQNKTYNMVQNWKAFWKMMTPLSPGILQVIKLNTIEFHKIKIVYPFLYLKDAVCWNLFTLFASEEIKNKSSICGDSSKNVILLLQLLWKSFRNVYFCTKRRKI